MRTVVASRQGATVSRRLFCSPGPIPSPDRAALVCNDVDKVAGYTRASEHVENNCKHV